jgi:hypothetical protein
MYEYLNQNLRGDWQVSSLPGGRSHKTSTLEPVNNELDEAIELVYQLPDDPFFSGKRQ